MILVKSRFARRHLLPVAHFTQRIVSSSLCSSCPAALTTSPMGRLNSSYEEAISSLNSLQSNASVIDAAMRRARLESRAADPSRNLILTNHYLSLIGLTTKDLKDLNVIHVSGTKGKGSTCAFTESMIRKHGFKTGFYSSPHLVETRERIRINGEPISRDLFAHYFWNTYDQIGNKTEESVSKSIPPFPPYFMFLTVMALNVFVKERVDAAIIEVGIGGEYDCTNVFREPVVVGITSLALDHVEVLGNTMQQIAWQKAGIMKANVPAFTVEQEANALTVLQERAVEKGCSLQIVPSFGKYQSMTSSDQDELKSGDIVLGIPGDVQRINASLAVQLTHSWLSRKSRLQTEVHSNPSPVEMCLALNTTFLSGLSECKWPGRYQVLKTNIKLVNGMGSENEVTYYLDGAHTKESISFCIDWFNRSTTSSQSLGTSCSLSRSSSQSAAKGESGGSEARTGLTSSSSCGGDVIRILLFNCTGYRNPADLLTPIQESGHFDVVLFSPNKVNRDKKMSNDQSNFTIDSQSEEKRVQDLKDLWTRMQSEESGKRTSVCLRFDCLSETVAWIQSLAEKEKRNCSVLVTGSLHLVGGVLAILTAS